MKPGGKVLLFFSSYLPCWIIYSINKGLELNAISYIGFSFIAISIFTLYVFKKTYEIASKDTLTPVLLTKISNGSSEVVSYIISLIIPASTSTVLFDVFNGTLNQTVIATIVLSITIFFVYINSNLVVINPVMMIIGYSLYLIEYKLETNPDITLDGILITNKKTQPEKIATPINLQKIDKSVYLLYR